MLAPTINIIIPHIYNVGREDGLRKCVKSILDSEYLLQQIQILIIEDNPRLGVPHRLKQGVEQTKGEYIVFGSNDILFYSDTLKIAIQESRDLNKQLISFNTGPLLPDNGNICEHFMIKRTLLSKLENQEIFSLDFNHVGCDNWLWAQAELLNEAYHSTKAQLIHNHFSKGFDYDTTYQLGWSKHNEDRKVLKHKLNNLYNKKELL